jgi:hypothetical protein
LCVVRAFVDKNNTTAIAAVNGVGPPEYECDAQTIESRTVERAFPNFPGIDSLAGSIRGNHCQIARTSVSAIAGLDVISFPPPFVHTSIFLLDVHNSVRTEPAPRHN